MRSLAQVRILPLLPVVSLVSVLLLLLLPASADPDAVTVIITLTNVTSPRPVSPNFVSFSLETSSVQGWVGSNASAVKPSFLTLMRALMLTPNAPGPILRIGGNSADTSWWNPSNLPLPPNITYSIQPLDVQVTTNAVRAINGSAVFGLNFRRASNDSWAVAHAQGIDQWGDWSRTTLEIGNEVDLYGGNGIRNSSFTYAEYDVEWTQYAKDIAAAVPRAPAKLFQGLTVAGRGWYPNITAYSTEHQRVLATVSVHAYPTTHCNGRVVTIPQILADAASNTDATDLSAYNLPSNLAALGIPLQLGEGNSASCGGYPGVSNVFASALWALDDLYNLAGIGMRGFNYHGGHS